MNENAYSRRQVLAAAGAVGLSRPASGAHVAPLPVVKFLGHDVTRLIIGSNPLYGYSHFNPIFDRTMRDWMTQARRMDVLHRCEQNGINTWQVHYSSQFIEDLRRYRAEGGKMQFFLLGMGDLMKDFYLIKEVAKLGPLGIAHHGNMTDDRFRAGEMAKLHEWLKAVKDAGVPAGVSTHNPAVVDFLEGKGWAVDYYMTCMYRVTRTPEEARAEFGEAPMGEIYMERDPERMCKMVRATRRPCLAFKALAAGRSISKPERVEAAFRFVLSSIKPGDAMIVGMFPRDRDEIAENASLVRKICGEAGNLSVAVRQAEPRPHGSGV